MPQRFNIFLLTSIDYWAGRCMGSYNFWAPRSSVFVKNEKGVRRPPDALPAIQKASEGAAIETPKHPNVFRLISITGNTQKVQSCPKALNEDAPSPANKRDQRLLKFLRNCVSSYSVTRKDRYQLVRPLLCLNRCDVMKLCRNWCLPVYPDVTNERLQFFRNRLRKQLIPLLRYSFNPQFDKNVFQSSQLFLQEQLRTEMAFLKLDSFRDTTNYGGLSFTQLKGVHSEGRLGLTSKVLIIQSPLLSKSNTKLIFNSLRYVPSMFLMSAKNSLAVEPLPLPFYTFYKGFKDSKTLPTLKDDINQSIAKWHYLFSPEIGSCLLFKD